MAEATVAKPPVNPAVAAETARCRRIIEECVASMKRQVASGTFPADVCGVLGREILTKLGGA